MASAASRLPSGERASFSAPTDASMGETSSLCPMTPVEATMTSRASMPQASAASSHIRRATAGPSALQVLALPLLHSTACARPSARFSRVTVMGAPLTRFFV